MNSRSPVAQLRRRVTTGFDCDQNALATSPGAQNEDTPVASDVCQEVNVTATRQCSGSFNPELCEYVPFSIGSLEDFSNATVSAPTLPPPPAVGSGNQGSNASKQNQPGTWQNVKRWLCNTGNTLEDKADALGKGGLGLELAGSVVMTAGLIGQPEVNPVAAVTLGVGIATTLTGGAESLIGTTFQIAGGIAQMLGSSDSSPGQANAIRGSTGMLFGAAAAWAGGSAPTNAAFAGAAADGTTASVPGMSSLQADCGGN